MHVFERLRLVLARTAAVGVGCQYWSLTEYGIPPEHLKELGLATLLKTRIPACEDHGCHAITRCERRVVFAEAQPGRANRKFRLTEAGAVAADDVAELANRVRQVPLAQRILDTVAQASEPLTGFDLYWRLLEPDLDDLASTGAIPTPRLTRPAVRLYLDLLIAAGWLHEDPGDGTIRPASR